MRSTDSEDPWDFFVLPIANNKVKKAGRSWDDVWTDNLNKNLISYSCRSWLFHLAQLGLEKVEFLNQNLRQVKVSFLLTSATFWIELNMPDNYPCPIDEWSCTFQPLFSQICRYERAKYGCIGDGFKLNSIGKLVYAYQLFVKKMEDVLLEIKDLNSFEFSLEVDENDLSQLELDEAEPSLIIVRLRLNSSTSLDDLSKLTLILYLDFNDILAYPNRIFSEPLSPHILQKIDPLKWVLDRRLYDNLLALFSDLLYSEGDSF